MKALAKDDVKLEKNVQDVEHKHGAGEVPYILPGGVVQGWGRETRQEALAIHTRHVDVEGRIRRIYNAADPAGCTEGCTCRRHRQSSGPGGASPTTLVKPGEASANKDEVREKEVGGVGRTT